MFMKSLRLWWVSEKSASILHGFYKKAWVCKLKVSFPIFFMLVLCSSEQSLKIPNVIVNVCTLHLSPYFV